MNIGLNKYGKTLKELARVMFANRPDMMKEFERQTTLDLVTGAVVGAPELWLAIAKFEMQEAIGCYSLANATPLEPANSHATIKKLEAILKDWADSIPKPEPYKVRPYPPMDTPALLVQGEELTEAAPKSEQPTSLKSLGNKQTSTPDPQRRLARLRELGGNAMFKYGKWQFPGIAALERAEAAEGRNRRSQKTIRDDLKAAAELEHQEKREGRWCSGLGAK